MKKIESTPPPPGGGSGSVEECLTRDRPVAGSSPTGVMLYLQNLVTLLGTCSCEPFLLAEYPNLVTCESQAHRSLYGQFQIEP